MKKILLVEGDKSLLQKLGKRLGKGGFEVKTASDGAGALESALVEKPDLIITNYHLALFDAERLKAFLKSNPTTTHIPFIYLIDAERGHDETLASISGDTYLVKPFRWQDIQDKISGLFQPGEDITPPARHHGSGVEGSLKEVSLVDLLQIFGLNRRTGVLTLEHDGQTGSIHLFKGDVISAVLGETNGEKALFRIFRWPDGRFSYQPGEKPVTRNISRSMDGLLMEGMRQLDEWVSIHRLMPPPSTVLKMTKSREELPLNMRPVTQEVLLLLEFYNTVEEIVEKTPHTDYDVCKSILGLIQKGILIPVVEEKQQTRKEGPLVDPELLLHMHRFLIPAKSDQAGMSWGKIMVFSRHPEPFKLFLAKIADVSGFRLSRDNFSNREIISASFGTVGVLEISESAHLQIFLLPASKEAVPLWRAFSEGAMGAVFLENGDDADDPALEAIQGFVEGELGRPVIITRSKLLEAEKSGNSGVEIFRDLFSAMMDRHTFNEGSQA